MPNGLGDAFVYDVLETSDGDIWIATWSGANRILGGKMDEVESWELYTVDNTGGGLPNDWVYGLAEAPDGSIWFATEGGLARYEQGRWRNWDHEDGLGAPYELVEKSIQFRSDPATQSGHHALQKQDQELEHVNVAYNPNYVVGLAIDAGGEVWAGTWGGGLSRFDGETWRTFTIRDGLRPIMSSCLRSTPTDGCGSARAKGWLAMTAPSSSATPSSTGWCRTTSSPCPLHRMDALGSAAMAA